MKINSVLVTGLLMMTVGCASNVDYFYPNTGLQSDEVAKMTYAEVIAHGEKAYEDGFYSESSRLFMEARQMAESQNVTDQAVLEANSQKEFQAMFKENEIRLRNAVARYGDTHAEVAEKEFDLAKSYDSIGQPEKAAIHFQRAIDIGEIVLSPNDLTLQTYYSMMGYLMRDTNQHAKSLKYYDKATGGDIDSYSQYPQARTGAHYNYGLAYKGLGQRSKAFNSMDKAWQECQKYMHEPGSDQSFCNRIKTLRDELKN